jgi:hypothetical protein
MPNTRKSVFSGQFGLSTPAGSRQFDREHAGNLTTKWHAADTVSFVSRSTAGVATIRAELTIKENDWSGPTVLPWKAFSRDTVASHSGLNDDLTHSRAWAAWDQQDREAALMEEKRRRISIATGKW